MPKIADRVAETTTTTGTGPFALAGAKTGMRPFVGPFAVGDVLYYTAAAGAEWEVGVGTLGAATLSRDTVLSSSNAGALVAFSVGVKDLFCSAPARQLAGGTVDVPYSTVIKLTGAEQMAQKSVVGATLFTLDASGAVDGAVVQLDLIANGTNTPTFAGDFRQWGGSMAYNNNAGIRNSLTFFRRSGICYYSISVAVGAVAEVVPAAPAITTQPAIIGTPQVGVASSYTPGTVTGSPVPTGSQQWVLDSGDIAGGTGATYTPTAGQDTHSLAVRQIASNASGAPATSTSVAKTIAAALTAPGAVQALAVGTTTTSAIPLTWTAPATGGAPSDYEIQYAAAGTSFASPTTFADGVSASTGGTVTGLSGGPFDVRVRATNGAGPGPYTSVLGVTLAAGLALPGPVTALAAGTLTSSTIPLTWTAPSTGGGSITDYVIQYATAGTSFASPTTFADGTSASTGGTITGLTGSASYDVRVAAVNATGTGAYTNLLNQTLPAAAGGALVVLLNIVTLAESPTGVYTSTATSGPKCSGDSGVLGFVGDGYMSVDMSDTGGFGSSNAVVITLDAAQNVADTGSADYLVSCDYNGNVTPGTNGTFYAANPGGLTAAPAAGKRIRINRVGTTVTIESSTNGGVSWAVAYTFPITSSVKLYPKWWTTVGSTPYNVIRNPRTSAMS